MVTKGIVEKVLNKWYARVRIPMYDGREDSEGSTSDINLSQATVCALPNTITNLGKDDIVYVTFEDDDIGKPVIVGWLQKGTGNNSEVGLTLSTLTTKSTTILDKQTYIGNIQPFEIQTLENIRDNIQGQIDLTNYNVDQLEENIEQDLTELNNKVNKNTSDITTINTDLTPIKQALDGYQISKGTVEERLTNLGFKEGSITMAPRITATTNYVKRQGNYVIGELEYNTFSTGVWTPKDESSYTETIKIGTIPEIFRPTKQVNISVTSSVNGYYGIGEDVVINNAFVKGVIKTNGDIVLTYTMQSMGGSAWVDFRNDPAYISFGYEAAPITT